MMSSRQPAIVMPCAFVTHFMTTGVAAHHIGPVHLPKQIAVDSQAERGV